MSLNQWKVAQLATPFVTDPQIALKSFLSTHWADYNAGITPSATAIKFDTKFGDASKMFAVIVEKMPTVQKPEGTTLGKSRQRVYDNYRIQIFARGFSSINDAWKMKENIDSLLGANPTAMRSDGIDEIELGDFERINLDENNPNTGQAKPTLICRYVAVCTLIYDKYI